jgi:hypothetical protein
MLPKERAPMRRKTAMAVGPWMPDFLGESLDAARRGKRWRSKKNSRNEVRKRLAVKRKEAT